MPRRSDSYTRGLPLIAMLVIVAGSVVYPDSGFSFLRSGEYAHYLDTRGTTNFYRGIACLLMEDGTAAFLLSNRDLDSGEKHDLVIGLTHDEQSGYAIVRAEGVPQDPSHQVAQSWVDLLNFLSMRESLGEIGPTPTEHDDPWESYTLVYRFSEVYPLFGFDRIRLSDSDEATYKLDRVGRITVDNAGSFFEIGPTMVENDRPAPVLDLGVFQGEYRELGAVRIRLDNRWDRREISGCPSFWLKGTGERDSQLTVEEPDRSLLDPSIASAADYGRWAMSHANALPSTIEVRTHPDSLEVQFELLDQQGIRNVFRLRFWSKPESFYILNFSSFFDIYKENLEYYEAVLSSAVWAAGEHHTRSAPE